MSFSQPETLTTEQPDSTPATTGPWLVNGIEVITTSSICEISESQGWWRRNQGGLSFDNGTMEGIAVGSCPCAAEFLNDSNMITRIARQGEGASLYGQRLSTAQKALDQKNEVGVLIERRHPELERRGIKLPDKEQYALMGWWILTDIWVDWQSEKGKTFKVLMGRFEVVDQQSIWWASQNEATGDEKTTEPSSASETVACGDCGRMMISRYEGAVFCGHPDCKSSQTAASTAHLPATRTYRRQYLAARTSMEGRTANPYPYLPDEPKQLTKDQLVEVIEAKKTSKSLFSERPMWQSYICKVCKVFNQRTAWAKLVCRKCHNVIPIKLPDITFEDVVDDTFYDMDIKTNIDKYIKIDKAAVTRSPRTSTTRAFVETFDLHDNNRIMVLFPKKSFIDARLRGLFERAFELYQSGDLDIIRGLTQSFQHGQRTAWFGVNFGVPYNTRMTIPNITMDDCPSVIKEIIEVMTDMLDEALGQRPEFNEILSIGNYPKQHMGFHSDGENNVVGEVVASLSLGSMAHMSFALNNQYSTGRVRGNGYVPKDPIVAGTQKEDEKRTLHNDFTEKKITQEEYDKRMGDITKPLQAPSTKKSLLDFPLPFGTVMAQVGKTVNKLYAHEVNLNPKGVMRMVCTGRKLIEPNAADEAKHSSDNEEDGNEDEAEFEQKQEPKKKRKAGEQSSTTMNKKARKG